MLSVLSNLSCHSPFRLLDLDSASVATVTLKNVPPPRADPFNRPDISTDADFIPKGTKQLDVDLALPINQKKSGQVDVTLRLPDGYHLTKGAGSSFSAQVIDDDSGGGRFILQGMKQVMSVPLSESPGDPSYTIAYTWDGTRSSNSTIKLRIANKVYFCMDSGPCLFQQVCVCVCVTYFCCIYLLSCVNVVYLHRLLANLH